MSSYPRELIKKARETPKLYFDYLKKIAIKQNDVFFFPTAKGNAFCCKCPLHRNWWNKNDFERTPSMRIVDTSTIAGFTDTFWMFKCFSCGKAGDIFNLIMEYEDVSFKEALHIVMNDFKFAKRHRRYNPMQLKLQFPE